MRRFEALGNAVPIGGGVSMTWWTGTQHSVAEDPHRAPAVPPPESEKTPSSSITRPMCACKMLGQGGCAVPQEGAPAPMPGVPEEGPSTLAVVGGVGAVGILALLAAGVL